MTRMGQLGATERRRLTAREHRCLQKTQYASERIANIRADQIADSRGVMLLAYRCPFCKKWHHTSKRKR